ncbi:MAG: ATP-binding protein, partial [Lachnospiraceae bacterium]|nr:ATP-binding protein [Candidatus Hippenecus merdae]
MMNIGQENESQEFKESLSQLDKGLKSLTAMLNRHGTGSVYFGVDDNGNVKGLTIGKKTLMDIRSRIRDIIEPQILVNIEELKDEDSHQYIKVSAKGTDTPYS